jgi:sec-independent protein translocase protein TatA
MLGGMRPMELAVIALIILVFFGAKKIPEMGKGLGEGIRNFKKSIKGDDDKDEKSDKKSA